MGRTPKFLRSTRAAEEFMTAGATIYCCCCCAVRRGGGCRGSLAPCFALIELLLVVLLRQVHPANPAEAHLVDRPLPCPTQFFGSGLNLLVGVLSCQRDHVQDRPGRHNRRDIVRVVVNEMPVVVEVRATDHLGHHRCARGRINQLETLVLAANVHVRLERGDARRPVQPCIAIRRGRLRRPGMSRSRTCWPSCLTSGRSSACGPSDGRRCRPP